MGHESGVSVRQPWTEEGLLLHMEAGRDHLISIRHPSPSAPTMPQDPAHRWPRPKLVHPSTATNVPLFNPFSALAILWRGSSKGSHGDDKKGHRGLKHSKD